MTRQKFLIFLTLASVCAAQNQPREFFRPVRQAVRGKGIGKALLSHLAKECVTNNWSRLQWSVLDWNAPSIAFYKSLGAVMMDEWTICKVTGPALNALAEGRS